MVMASIVYFRKTSEDPNGVRYSFGFEPDSMERTLFLDTATKRAQPDDGNVDYEFLKTSRKINSLFTERGSWPERGSSVS
jgi:hypothetical protein